MKAVTRRRWLAALAVWAMGTAVWAEVGAVRDTQRPDHAHGYQQSVVDEPEPIGIWTRISPPNDHRRFVLNSDGDARGDGAPSMGYDPVQQAPLVLWARQMENHVGVVISRFQIDMWTAPQPINGMGGQQADPTVYVQENGAIHVAWWDQLQSKVYYQGLPAGSETWIVPIQVSDDGEIASRPSIVVYEGLVLVVYETAGGGEDTFDREVKLAVGSGAGITRHYIGGSAHDGPLWPQVHESGRRVWIDWIGFTAGEPYNGEMSWIRLQPGGTWSPVRHEGFDSEEFLEYHVRGLISNMARGLGASGTDPNDPSEP